MYRVERIVTCVGFALLQTIKTAILYNHQEVYVGMNTINFELAQ